MSPDNAQVPDFKLIDKELSQIGIPYNRKIHYYKILAAILHLGNVIFQEDSISGKCRISQSTKPHTEIAVTLLNIEQSVLEAAILTRYIEIGSEKIK